MDRNKLYKIETETRSYIGYVLSEGADYIQIVYEEENSETHKVSEKNREIEPVLVPQIINIRWGKIISYQRVYENEEIEEYYFPQKSYTTGGKYIVRKIFISKEQKKYILDTLFNSEKECQKACDVLNKNLNLKEPPEVDKKMAKSYIDFVKNNPEADKEFSDEFSKKEVEDGRR